MKIQHYRSNNSNTSFKGKLATAQPFVENPKDANFVKNIALNSAIEVLHDDRSISFLPSGSWITGTNYDPEFSDHDFTLLIPNNCPYDKMEAKVVDTRNRMKEIVSKKLESHKIPYDTAQQKISTINIFPTPQIKAIFNSYDQFRSLTNLKISLNDKNDPDKGLWQMKSAIVQHFKNEGNYLGLKNNGSLEFFGIKENEKKFFHYMDKKDIYMPRESELFASDKLKIINEFIDILKNNEDLNKRAIFKYLQRVGKFLFKYSTEDLFLVSGDKNKNTLPKFEKMVKEEDSFHNQYNKISGMFKTIKSTDQISLPEKAIKPFLKDLMEFKEKSIPILERPILKGFKGL